MTSLPTFPTLWILMVFAGSSDKDVLMIEEIAKSRAEYFRKITQDRINAVDNDVMKEQRPEMPMNINRQSRVTFGGGNKS